MRRARLRGLRLRQSLKPSVMRLARAEVEDTRDA